MWEKEKNCTTKEEGKKGEVNRNKTVKPHKKALKGGEVARGRNEEGVRGRKAKK